MLGYVDINSLNYNPTSGNVLNLYQTSNNAIERGAHWIYMLVDTIIAYDFNIFYYVSPTFLLVGGFLHQGLFLETSLWEIASNTLTWSRSIDAEIWAYIWKNPYINEWTRNLLNSLDRSLVLYIHPEAYYYINTQTIDLSLPFVSDFFETISLLLLKEGFFNPIFAAFEVLVIIYFVVIFLAFFFSYYNNSSQDENTIDQDFFLASASVEAEEEIASIEDISVTLIVLVFVFGWFFYANCPFLLNNIPELSFSFYFLPFLYYIIVFIPTFLVYDFGIFFLTYLRGASPTASLAMELLYDYIAFAAFYVRLAVQNVRLLLMLFTYFSLYECIMVYATPYNSEILWQTENTHWNYTNYNSYYFLLKLPTQILYWVYELLHTFFVLTAQFTAFFAMVFWLFLFLYTMFVAEQQERFFAEKKEKRKQIIKKLWK